MTKSNKSPEEIDQLLPQTQCGLCGYGGCMPYAEAMVYDDAPINLCPPGGIPTLRNLGQLLQIDPEPYVPDMVQKAKPKLLAMIREAECIGCAKCIQACPVDAILGAAKQMHTVLSDECTGCELCVPPCPVDCISLLPASDAEAETTKESADHARERYLYRQNRIAKEKAAKVLMKSEFTNKTKQSYIKDAILRAKQKKSRVQPT